MACTEKLNNIHISNSYTSYYSLLLFWNVPRKRCDMVIGIWGVSLWWDVYRCGVVRDHFEHIMDTNSESRQYHFHT